MREVAMSRTGNAQNREKYVGKSSPEMSEQPSRKTRRSKL
eukprot:CAMPEP_0168501452 /NCGR_PEP_ID=MMETSP0228-20121227/74810_1 /TAXON_ID=133427 /ORGANISM="Protoceratium reticulatum, Strain CCCM 535 (=CCMP 1889)" /LENGTH=39 /DNA_ID= /DNA_START= /DNA_END= /DNA_ORIENTATION=